MFQPDKIIIADDHPLFRQALTSVLTSNFTDVTILEAESVAALENTLTEHSDADLLLLDLNIPGAQGFGTLIHIRNTFAEMGVIVVSGYEDKDTISKSIANGAAGFIPKSTSVEEMLTAIQSVLAGNVWLPDENNISLSSVSSEVNDKIASLTPQQYKILTMFADGLLNKQIAYELGVSEATVKSHSSAIFLKLGVKSRTQAVIMMNQLQMGNSSFSGEFE